MDLQLAAAAAKIYEALDNRDPEQRADLAVMLARRLSGDTAQQPKQPHAKRYRRKRALSAQRRVWLEALRPAIEETAHLTCERAAAVLTERGLRASRGGEWTSSSVWSVREQIAKLDYSEKDATQ